MKQEKVKPLVGILCFLLPFVLVLGLFYACYGQTEVFGVEPPPRDEKAVVWVEIYPPPGEEGPCYMALRDAETIKGYENLSTGIYCQDQ